MLHPANLFEKLIPALLAAGLLTWIVAKAVILPVTIDEAQTVLYFSRMSIWDIVTYADPIPNNHILNTLLVKFSVTVFGLTPFAVRLPNILGFVLFIYFSWRMMRELKVSPFFVTFGIVMLVSNPYFIDFFSLARGYALSIAFMIGAFCFLLRWVRSTRRYDLIWSMTLMAVAVYANFTLLNMLVAFATVVFCVVVSRNDVRTVGSAFRQLVPVFIGCALLAAVSAVPVIRMIQTDQFHYWASESFYKNTLLELIRSFIYGGRHLAHADSALAVLAITLSVVALVVSVWLVARHKGDALRWQIVIVTGLLWITVMVNNLQFFLIKTPFLDARTALFYWPLFALMVIFLVAQLHRVHKTLFNGVAVLLTAGGLFHLSQTMTMTGFREWWFDANTKEILDVLEEVHESREPWEKVTLNTNWRFHNSFRFHKEARGYDWLELSGFHLETDTASNAEFYYIMAEELPLLEHRYERWRDYGWQGGRPLLKLREAPRPASSADRPKGESEPSPTRETLNSKP